MEIENQPRLKNFMCIYALSDLDVLNKQSDWLAISDYEVTVYIHHARQ